MTIREKFAYAKEYWTPTLTKLTLLGVLCFVMALSVVLIEAKHFHRFGFMFYFNLCMAIFWVWRIPSSIKLFLGLEAQIRNLDKEIDTMAPDVTKIMGMINTPKENKP